MVRHRPLRIPDPPGASRLRKALNAWYRKHRRALPWRDVDDPYRVLVSEFMLQQTQVATVLPYFDAFLRRFPDLRSLAEAPENTVRASWSGLGYYRRARNLQATAQTLVRDHGGALPGSYDELRALPGVGDYTAAALGSLVHGLPRAVVDGNVIRVLTRLVAYREVISRTKARRALQELADALLDPRRPGDWNQAMMELGATVCLPRKPRCDACPWRGACLAYAAGEPERYPVKDAARASVNVTRAVAVLRRGGAVYLVRRSDPRLLDGTWELPGVDVEGGGDPRDALAEHLERVVGCAARVGAELVLVKHAITHRRLTVSAYAVQTRPLPRARKDRGAWVTFDDASDYPMSSMTAKLLKELAKLPPPSKP
jgi:A/G-specific adenine glycosylase